MDLSGRRVVVMGLGRFGGGIGVTRWLIGRAAHVLVTDLQTPEQLSPSLARLEDLLESGGVELRLGGHESCDFTSCDLVVANPAVPKPWENPFLQQAEAAGIPVTTEIRLLVEQLDRRRVIGVTGTAGKSTTAAMIHHILTRSGHTAHIGGNIGGSLQNDLMRANTSDWVVLELSSAMLYWLGQGIGIADAGGWSPHVAVMLNLEPNHLDWHGTFEHYAESKRNVCRYQQADGDDVLVFGVPRGGEPLSSWQPVRPHAIHPEEIKPVPLEIPGRHNQHNAFFAATAAAVALRDTNAVEQYAARLSDFQGLPHRLQLVATLGPQKFYDDSKSTTPQATRLAVAAFDEPGRVHLIAGGYDKGLDLKPIIELVPRLAGLYTIGATGSKLAGTASDRAVSCDVLETAVRHAMARMESKDVLLLSPGCASWDQFDNYEQRGDAFCNLVGEAIRKEELVQHREH